MNTDDANRIFSLPELTQHIARHLSQGSLYQCIQVSTTWHATFISHLWRIYSDEPKIRSEWFSSGSSVVLTDDERRRADREWFNEVFSRHARYVRHLTISRPISLDGILKGAFVQQQSPSPAIMGGQLGDEASSKLPMTSASSVAGRSMVTNLESLTVSVTRQSLGAYFRVVNLRTMAPDTTGTGGLFGVSNIAPSLNNGFLGTIDDNNGHNQYNGHAPMTDGPTTAPTTARATLSNEDPEKPFIDACQRLILCNPHLRTLSCTYFPQLLQGISSTSSDDILLPALKNLSVVSADSRIPTPLPPNVTGLTLTCRGRLDFVSTGYPSNQAVVHAGLETLVTHNVESGAHLRTLLAVTPSLKTLSVNSSALVFYYGPDNGSGPDSNGFGQTIGTPAAGIPVHPSPPSLIIDKSSWPVSSVTVLKCKQPPFSYSTAFLLDSMLDCFPHLVEFHGHYEWFPTIAAQLCQNCPLLEFIRIRQKSRGGCTSSVHNGDTGAGFSAMGHRGIAGKLYKLPPRRLEDPVGDDVSIVLLTLTRLRVLDIPYATIKAENVGDPEKPWVCMGLEGFRCQIVGVPFLTEDQERRMMEIRQRETEATEGEAQFRTDEEEDLIALSERCISTTYKVMTQLSKLTSLKYLSLSPDLKIGKDLFVTQIGSGSAVGAKLVYKSPRDGKTYIRYDDVLPDTLHLRLDSGLDQLASLTELKYLGFESMDHRMRVAEVEWMARSWPRLREVRGLVTDGYLGVEPDPEKDALREVMRGMRPDVVLGQSFDGYGVMEGFSATYTRRR
ncbi:hypothetical protein BGW39_007190 [Mortierella sp. 14UC]|nr:hypothetical protein BGW39_007190 [Mortierella sp. 14UC]